MNVSKLSRMLTAGAVVAVLGVAFSGLVGCKALKPKPKGAFAAPCENNLDCENLKCNVERGKFCTKECHSDGDCTDRPDSVCSGDPTGTGASCAAKVGTATGGNCHDRADCDHGSCLHKGEDENGFCSQRCVSSADCPAGFKVCAQISDMGAQKLCLPGADANAKPPVVGVKKPGGTAPPPKPQGAGGGAGAAPPPPPPPAGGPPKPKKLSAASR